jgi:alkylation response protein AidB-like acyl-CoA dehydrogenase
VPRDRSFYPISPGHADRRPKQMMLDVPHGETLAVVGGFRGVLASASGSKAAKAELLRRLAFAEATFAEPDACANSLAIKTFASRLNGQKI